jgi:hypothetical protein
MKLLISIIAGVILLLNMAGCGQSNKSKILEQYIFDESKSGSNEMFKNKLDTWVKEGVTCYGIVIVYNESGLPIRIKEVNAKVISIQSDKIKMKSLEDIVMAPIKGCTKFSITKGEDWDEKEGDLFQTKEEAIKFIDTNYPGLRMKQ